MVVVVVRERVRMRVRMNESNGYESKSYEGKGLDRLDYEMRARVIRARV